jgi:hypothetical protein
VRGNNNLNQKGGESMRDFISPEIKSYTSKEILELIGPGETQYLYTMSEDLPSSAGNFTGK